MKNNITPVEKARIALETAKQVHEQAQAALSAFTGPFSAKEVTIKSEIEDEQRRLSQLRKQLAEFLDDPVKAEDVENETERAEKLLKRLEKRLEISQAWRRRESESLNKLEDEEQSAYRARQEAYEKYTNSWRDSVFQARQSYLNALSAYWQEAAASVSLVKFPKFRWPELEVTDLHIRSHCGPIKW